MPADQLLALATLAVVGSFTPGPNNVIATATGANHGLRATLPHILGVPFGFGTMLVAGSLGVAALVVAHPLLGQAIKWLGIAYLLVIAWMIGRASDIGERRLARPLTFWQSAGFQYANPKAWMLAAATAGTFMSTGSSAAETPNHRRRVRRHLGDEPGAVGMDRRGAARLAAGRPAARAVQPRDGSVAGRHRAVDGAALSRDRRRR